jgi:SAM-dependent methyltransferase
MPEEKNIRYIHHKEAHNLTAPEIIVPVLMDVLKPKSVVDVGCGIGTFLSVFHRQGVTDIRGYDGHWVDPEKLVQHIDPKYFVQADLEMAINGDRRFDLALCLEVAEHLNEKSSEVLVKNLIAFSDMIVFAAAIPGQMGQNHVNEQWPKYWENKFLKKGYQFHDVLRPIFWENDQVFRWYKQNMFLVVKKGQEQRVKNFKQFTSNNLKSYVHPEYFSIRVKELEDLKKSHNLLNSQFSELIQGKASFGQYFKILIKAILHRIKPTQ